MLPAARNGIDGRVESAIAADLGIPPHTVHTHFSGRPCGSQGIDTYRQYQA